MASNCKEKLIVECSVDNSQQICFSLFNLYSIGVCTCTCTYMYQKNLLKRKSIRKKIYIRFSEHGNSGPGFPLMVCASDIFGGIPILFPCFTTSSTSSFHHSPVIFIRRKLSETKKRPVKNSTSIVFVHLSSPKTRLCSNAGCGKGYDAPSLGIITIAP